MKPVPLVSVCIQTYRHVHYIEQCLQSVLSQKATCPFEIILGEDDSEDGTREICKRFKQQYPDLIQLYLRNEKDKLWIEGEKTGRYNFISNLRAARGKYIALLDGDDYWTDNRKLQKQVDFLEAHPDFTVCYCNYRNLKKGRLKTTLYLHFRKRDFFIHNIPLMHTGGVMFRNPGFEQVPDHFWETPFLDFPLYMHVTGKGKIHRLPDYMVVYREHDQGMWSGKNPEQQLLKYNSVYLKMLPVYDGIIRNFLCKKLEKNMMKLFQIYKKKNEMDKAGELAKFIAGHDDLCRSKLLQKNISRIIK